MTDPIEVAEAKKVVGAEAPHNIFYVVSGLGETECCETLIAVLREANRRNAARVRELSAACEEWASDYKKLDEIADRRALEADKAKAERDELMPDGCGSMDDMRDAEIAARDKLACHWKSEFIKAEAQLEAVRAKASELRSWFDDWHHGMNAEAWKDMRDIVLDFEELATTKGGGDE
jgi:hypothetical protein